jgi:hypothetical protein
LPLDVVEKIVRDSVAARRSRVSAGTVPTQADALKLWAINEEKAAPPPGYQVISTKPPPGAEGEAEAAGKPAVEAAPAKKAAKAATKPVAKSSPAKPATAVKASAKKAVAKAPAKSAARPAGKR